MEKEKKEDKPKIEEPKLSKGAKLYTKKQAIVALSAIGILLAGVVAASLLYINAKSDVSSKSDEIGSLKERIEAAESAEGEEEAPAEVVEEEPAPAADCDGGSDYSADIGNFEITLSTPRVIVRNLDAGFEGGPITSLEIGTCLEGENNVVDTPPGFEVSVLGHPASSSADLKTQYEATSGALTADGTMVIDGVTANKYTLSALFNTTVIYFDNAGIGYQIELSDTNSTTNNILTDLTTDWNFTP